jgi:hypothetical protein
MTLPRSKAFQIYNVLAGLSALALVGAPVSAQADPDEQAEKEMSKGEQRLAKLLEGRVAGEPQSCITTRPTGEDLTVIPDTAYVYGRGNTIYVQRTLYPERISRNDVLISQRFSPTRLCRQEIATTVDRFTGFFTGAVQLEDFVPYTRVEEDG